jgi:Domain of unknown function (DUF4116)
MSDTRPRLEKILDLHGQALSEATGKREPTSCEAKLSAKDLVLRFSNADPTPGKSRTQWLIKAYIKDDQFKLEDLGRADAALAAFERFKRRLPLEQRELSRFKSLRELETLVDPFVRAEARARLERDLSSATGREKRRLECVKARDESIIIQEEDGLPTIAVPMTEFASKWWGRGTKWCTAAEKGNIFNEYHKEAPLVVIVCPDGTKFQAYVTPKDIQFMDATDKDVEKSTIRERWSEFESIIYWMIEQNGYVLQYVPEEHRNLELCRLAIQRGKWAIEFVPKYHQTFELCYNAIQQNEQALQFIPKQHKTLKLCLMAIKQDGLELRNIPEKDRIPELCRLAVEQNGSALEYVPRKHHSEELYKIAVEQNGIALKYVPEEDRTPELCRIAVEQNGNALQYIPNKKRTFELRRIAVGKGFGLTSALSPPAIPSDSQTMLDNNEILELCFIAIQKNGLTLQDINEDHRTPELCRIAVEQNGWALEFVPEEQRTPELCRLAVEQNGMALYAVPPKFKKLDLCRIAVQQKGDALRHVPEEHKTIEICHISVQQNGVNIRYVAEEHKQKLYPLAVEQNKLALERIPENERTLELCLLAVQYHPHALIYVPEEHRTPELMALIPPVQPKWHPDILQGLGQQSQPFYDDIA